MPDYRHGLTTLTAATVSPPVPLSSPGATKASPRWYPEGRDAELRVASCRGKSKRAPLIYPKELRVCIPRMGRQEGCFTGQHFWVLSAQRWAAPVLCRRIGQG